MTPFRSPQVGAVLRSVVVGLAPHCVSVAALRHEVRMLFANDALWAALMNERVTPKGKPTMSTSPVMEAPIR